jgi:calcyphosin
MCCKVIQKVREDLMARGAQTIRGLGRAFRIMDMEGDRKLDKQEFYWGLKDMGCQLSKDECAVLLECLDTNHDGYINFDEFLLGVRGRPNEVRQERINAAFDKFNVDGGPCVRASDLRSVYDCSMHPRVQSGEMTTDEVFTEFLASFGDKNGDGAITKSEWNDYYAAVSASMDNDDHFVLMMNNAWKM